MQINANAVLAEVDLKTTPDPVQNPDCPGYDCNLHVSTVACLFAAWAATRVAARRWVGQRDLGLWGHSEAEIDLRAWLQLPDAPAFAADLKVALLSVRHPERRPHLSNESVAFQPSELEALGYSVPTVVLHWILSPELLPLVGNDTPVCGAERDWRFGCVPPCPLSASAYDSADFPSDKCALFCRMLSETYDSDVSFTPFRVLWEGRKRVHIFPCMKGDPFELCELRLAVGHPDSLLSLHVEAGDGVYRLRDRLRSPVPDAPSWSVLRGPADGDLVLPVAWDTALTAKQSGLYSAPRMHAYVVSHGQPGTEEVVQELAAGAHAFFLRCDACLVARGTGC